MRTLMFAVVAASMLLFAGAVCQAQPGLPPGDYGQTCREMGMNGGQLQAHCQARDGSWRSTSLDYRDCHGSPVINDDGQLRCGTGKAEYAFEPQDRDHDHDQDRDHDRDHDRDRDRDRHRDWDNGLPRGSYRETCHDVHLSGDRLDASCQKKNGKWRNTTLKDVDSCRGPIVNDNGRLRCDR